MDIIFEIRPQSPDIHWNPQIKYITGFMMHRIGMEKKALD